MDDEQIEGRADEVLKRMLNAGHLDEAEELMKVLVTGEGGIDISVAYRAGLIGQGFETEAMQLAQVTLFLHDNGFMVQYDSGIPGDWMDNRSAELSAAFETALVWVMRGGNMDAYVRDGHVYCRGPIIATNEDEVEHLVGQFVEEINEQFPDTPPKREGKWW